MRLCPAIFFLLLLTIACEDSSKKIKNENPQADKKSPISHKPSSGFADTLKINFAAAIFYTPDSVQWEKLKHVNDSMVYASFEHDCFFQMRNAGKVLKQNFHGVKIIEAVKIRYLLFEMSNGQSRLIDLDSIADPCGVILFRKEKEPHPADMTNIDTESDFYFKQ
jgi:hypothetical protein